MNDYEALKILSAGRAISFQEISAAYKKLAISLHPDRSKEKPEIAGQQFKQISGAFRYLEDRYKNDLLVLPVVQGSNGVGQVPKELVKFLNPETLKKLVDYLVTKTPKWMQPTLKQVCADLDPLAIINFILRNKIRIPSIFSPKKRRPKPKSAPKNAPSRKPSGKKHAKQVDMGFVAGRIIKKAVINQTDHTMLRQLPIQERAAQKVRCVLETRNLDSGASKLEYVELSLPEGLNPSGKINLDGHVWDIELSDAPWGGGPPIGSIANPKIDTTSGHKMSGAPNAGMSNTVQNVNNIAAIAASQRSRGKSATPGAHTPPQKLGPGDNFWPPGQTFLP